MKYAAPPPPLESGIIRKLHSFIHLISYPPFTVKVKRMAYNNFLKTVFKTVKTVFYVMEPVCLGQASLRWW